MSNILNVDMVHSFDLYLILCADEAFTAMRNSFNNTRI